MQVQSFFLILFICLSIASIEPVNAFHKQNTPSRQTTSTCLSSSVTTSFDSEKQEQTSISSSAALNAIGGSTVFPPPKLIRKAIAFEKTLVVVQDEARQDGAKEFLAKYKTTIMAVCLMGFTGVVESICYRHFGVYPNMMTGNTVKAMNAVSSLRWNDMKLYLGLIGSYMCGGALFKFLDRARVFSNKIPTFAWLSAVSFAFFALSDAVGLMTNFSLMRLWPMATAFGMINCATQEMTGFVTNAATGHFGKVAFGLGEALVINMLPRTQVDKAAIKNGISSALIVGAFMTSLISTNLIGMWLDARHPWVIAKLPPLGLSLGAAYTALLASYHYFSKKI